MNINSYPASLLNTYSPVSGNQTSGGGQIIQLPQSGDALKQGALQSSENNVNGFSINISREARQLGEEAALSQPPGTTSLPATATFSEQETAAPITLADQQAQQLQKGQELQQAEQTLQTQQIKPQYYQSPYGQFPMSFSNIDLMA